MNCGFILTGGLLSLRSGSFRRGAQVAPPPEKMATSAEMSVEDMLKGLLNPSAPQMSPFRVLYNLEVRDPVTTDVFDIVLIVFRLCFFFFAGDIGKVDANVVRFNDDEQHAAFPAGIPAGRRIEPGVSRPAQRLFPLRRQLRDPPGLLPHRSPAGALPALRRGRLG